MAIEREEDTQSDKKIIASKKVRQNNSSGPLKFFSFFINRLRLPFLKFNLAECSTKYAGAQKLALIFNLPFLNLVIRTKLSKYRERQTHGLIKWKRLRLM